MSGKKTKKKKKKNPTHRDEPLSEHLQIEKDSSVFSKASWRDSDITASAMGHQRIQIDSSRGLIPKPIHNAKKKKRKKKKKRLSNDASKYINKL